MERADEEQVDNEVETEYQWVMLEEGRTLSPVFRIPLEFIPDADIVISGDEHSLANDIFVISPALGH